MVALSCTFVIFFKEPIWSLKLCFRLLYHINVSYFVIFNYPFHKCRSKSTAPFNLQKQLCLCNLESYLFEHVYFTECIILLVYKHIFWYNCQFIIILWGKNIWQGPAQYFHLIFLRSRFRAPWNGHANSSTYF